MYCNHGGLVKGTYIETTDNRLKEILRFKDFLHRTFYNYEHLKDMKFDSNQPARLFGTAKTHYFENLKDGTVANLKLKPTTNQTETFTCDATKVTSGYLRPLCKNQCSIDNFQGCYAQFRL